FPLTFVGIIPNWTIYSQTEGQNIYFINLSQEQRQAIYGDYIDMYIAQFTLHLLLFIVWFIVIVLPAFKRKRKKEEKTEKRFTSSFKVLWGRLKRHLTLLGLFMIFVGVLLGPVIGNDNEMRYNISSRYRSTQTIFDPTLGVIVESKSQANTTVEFSSDLDLINYNTSVMLTDNDTFINFFTDFDNLTQVYYDGNITYSQLLSSYFTLVNQAKLGSYYEIRLIHEDVINGTTLTLNATEETTSFYLITLVDEWNLTESFIYEARINISYTIDRDVAQIEGGILDGIGVAMIILDQILAPREHKKKIIPPT
ncbi:MAG: hypothetical protein ACTSQF_09035, partial [Candidatus Heimdallarchaeaceae archaeon]